MDELAPMARIVWKLARNHTWGQPIPEGDVIALVTKEEDSDEMRALWTQHWSCRSSVPARREYTFQTAKQNTGKLRTGFERTRSYESTRSERRSLDYHRSGRSKPKTVRST